MDNKEVRRGAAIYSKTVLSVYDMVVVRLSNSLAWRCPSNMMLAQYNKHLGTHHLDVGPGSGWYLVNADFPTQSEITLIDLNQNSVDYASSRLSRIRPAPRGVTGNILESLPDSLGEFDSIAMNFLLHCLPGSWADKSVAFKNLSERLTSGGVLFGSTILGTGVKHNPGGRGLMALYNRLGVFHNQDDSEEGLREALSAYFHSFSVETIGVVALFSATNPKTSPTR